MNIPVAAARMIGHDYNKSLVVILAYDPHENRLHTVTWGREAQEKSLAAEAGDKCTAVLGADLSKRETFQDYRFADQAKVAMLIDDLLISCQAADHAIASVMAQRNGITDLALMNVRDAIAKSVQAATGQGYLPK